MPTADVLRIEVESVEVRHLAAVGTIPGVVLLLASAKNGFGMGRLACSDVASLSWRAPRSITPGVPVECQIDGTYVLCDGEDPDRWIRVAVYTAYLVSGLETDVALAEVYNNHVGQADVTADEASTGDELEYSLALRNSSDETLLNLTVWLDSDGDSNSALSLDGEIWSHPESDADGLAVPVMAPGDVATICLKRTITAAASSAPKQRVHLHAAFDAAL